MALEKDAVTAMEAQNLLLGFDHSGKHHTTAADASTSFIIDPVAYRVGEAQVHAVADRFEEMVLFDELIDANATLSSQQVLQSQHLTNTDI